MTKRYWCGEPPKVCDITGIEIKDCFIDGQTKQGPWAIMTPESHRAYGRGLGQGVGQKYIRQGDGRWLKVAG